MRNINKVLLVRPKAGDEYYDLPAFKSIFGQKSHSVPFSLLSVAASLGPEWSYRLIDEEISLFSANHAAEADYILVSFSIPQQRESVERIARKSLELKKTVIVGGPVVTVRPDMVPDSVVKVLGEIDARAADPSSHPLSIAESLAHDMRLGALKPLYIASARSIVSGIPSPRYDLIDPRQYLSLFVQLSFGFQADECRRFKSQNQVKRELDSLFPFGKGKTIYILDDSFLGEPPSASQREQIMDTFGAIEEWQRQHGYPFDFLAKCSLQISDDKEWLDLFIRAGVNILSFPLEKLDITVPVEMLARRINTLQDSGLGVMLYFPFGYEGENKEALDYRIELVEKSGVPVALMFPVGNDKKIPKELIRIFHNTLYNPHRYFKRCLTWIYGWKPLPSPASRGGSVATNLSTIKWLRNVIFQGLFSSYRFEFIKYILSVIKLFRLNYEKTALALYLSYFYKDLHGKTR